MIQEILKHNRDFVASKGYEQYVTTKYPDKRLAIVTCMDTRLVEFLEAALGIQHGEAKMIKNAGGLITEPYDSTMRSVLVAVYELKVNEVMIIAHTDCGVQGMNSDEMKHLMRERGVSQHCIDMVANYSNIDLDKWLTGFEDTEQAVRHSVDLVKNHPLMPADVNVCGYVFDSVTGELRPVNIYE